MWYERTRALREAGELQLAGLIQEQHPDRCALFMQWKQMDFPIFVDSLNRTGVHAVPLFWAIDEHGVLRSVRPRPDWLAEFVATDHPAPAAKATIEDLAGPGRAFVEGRIEDAVRSYRSQLEERPGDAVASFRLGCAYRARHDSAQRQPGDFQAAIECWTRASTLWPANYIYRRRLQQYGPRLEKPYPFYDWVAKARSEIAARGATPVPLVTELEGSEVAQRIRRFVADDDTAEPDPRGRVPRDERGLVHVTSVVAPQPLAAGRSGRVYLRLTPEAARKVTWDDEAGMMDVWLQLPDGWRRSSRHRNESRPARTRVVELEIAVPEDARVGSHTLEGYALYYVCDGVTGECRYLRRDFDVAVRVAKARPERRGRRRR